MSAAQIELARFLRSLERELVPPHYPPHHQGFGVVVVCSACKGALSLPPSVLRAAPSKLIDSDITIRGHLISISGPIDKPSIRIACPGSKP